MITPTGCTANFYNPGQYFVGINDGNYDYAGGQWSAVLGGLENVACDVYSAIGGGVYNEVSNAGNAFSGFIGGGTANSVVWRDGAIGGGESNQAAGAAFVGAGFENLAEGPDSFIGSGASNTVTGPGSAIVAGDTIYTGFGQTSAGNQISGTDSFIGTGDQNVISGNEGFIGSGHGNRIASGAYSVIAGGNTNSATSNYAAVGGGFGNVAQGADATIPGGNRNEAHGELSFAAGYQAHAAHSGSFVWSDFIQDAAPVADTGANQFVVRASGGVFVYSSEDSPRSGVVLQAGSGTWASLSDRDAKTDVTELDDASILAKVAALPVNAWRYKTELGARHVGPMAQDFYAAFGVGEDDRHITSIDEDGVALAAIKALDQKLALQKALNERLQARLTALEAKVGKLVENR